MTSLSGRSGGGTAFVSTHGLGGLTDRGRPSGTGGNAPHTMAAFRRRRVRGGSSANARGFSSASRSDSTWSLFASPAMAMCHWFSSISNLRPGTRPSRPGGRWRTSTPGLWRSQDGGWCASSPQSRNTRSHTRPCRSSSDTAASRSAKNSVLVASSMDLSIPTPGWLVEINLGCKTCRQGEQGTGWAGLQPGSLLSG